MSIINDALKKAQINSNKPQKGEKAQNNQKPKESHTVNVYEKMYKDREEKSNLSSNATASKKRVSKNTDKAPRKAQRWFKTIFLVLFLVASLSYAFKFLPNYEPLEDLLRSVTGKTKSSRAHIAKYVPTERTYTAQDLVLNGISVIDGMKVALINDKIYRVGETVDNKKITHIDHDTVELHDGEEILTIRVR